MSKRDDEVEAIITFETTRGTIHLSAEMIDEAEFDDYPLRRHIAMHLPEQREGDVLKTQRRANRDGSATVTWHRIRTTVTPTRQPSRR